MSGYETFETHGSSQEWYDRYWRERHALEKRLIEQDRLEQHSGVAPQRLPAEASGGHRPFDGAEGQEEAEVGGGWIDIFLGDLLKRLGLRKC